MPQSALLATIAVYALLAILLLSLNLASLWRWWVKAAAIIITALCFIVAYFSITAMIGWPSFTPLPKRFNLVATRVVEPDRASGAPGHVYLWVEELNTNNVPVGAPRGYEVPYTRQLADNTATAQSQINAGKSILGQSLGGEAAEQKGAQPMPPGQQQPGQMNGNTGQGGLASNATAAAEVVGQNAYLTFSDMPPVTLPDKAFVPLPDSLQ